MSLTKVSYSMITGSELNILDYAANTNPGTTDMTAAFVAAIADAAVTGKTIFVPAGIYACGSIEFKSNVKVVGEPGSIIKRLGNYNWCLGVFDPAVDNVHIEGLQFDANAPGTAGTHKYSIFINKATNVTIRDCHLYNGYDISIKNLGPDGIYIRTDDPTIVNNILIERCLIDGFTRNGIAVTNGGNGITIRDCDIKNCGLMGIDFEPDSGGTNWIRNIIVDGCRFFENGDYDIAQYPTESTGQMQFTSPAPSTYVNTNVIITNCTFTQNTAENVPNGMTIFKVNSTFNFTMTNCVFNAPGGSGDYAVAFENGTYGSQNGLISGCKFIDVQVQFYNFAYAVMSGNQFRGGRAAIVSATQGANKIICDNVFENCGDIGYIIRTNANGVSINNNNFEDTRASGLPATVILLPTNGAGTITLNTIIDGNRVTAYSSGKYGAFVNMDLGSATTKMQQIYIKNNVVSGCDLGVHLVNNGNLPNLIDATVMNNEFANITGKAVRLYRGNRLNVQGNKFIDCAGNDSVITLDSNERYLCNGNNVADSRAGAARAQYAISAFNSAATTSSLCNNLSVNTQSGFSIAAGEGTVSNNVTY